MARLILVWPSVYLTTRGATPCAGSNGAFCAKALDIVE